MKVASVFQPAPQPPQRINIEGEKLQKGLAKLVLTVVEVLRELLERQAIRRIDEGSLSKEEVEKLGVAFMQLKERLAQLTIEMGLQPEELNLDLGVLGPLRSEKSPSLVDVVDKLIDKGTLVAGEVLISVADVDLIALDLLLMLSGVRRPATR